MPGYELINYKERIAVNKLFKEGGVLFAHGFDNLRKRYHVREFERECSKYFKVNNCLAVSSGTAAIKIGLKALGVKEGDEVITQAFNFIATVEAILDLKAIPVIVNVDKSLNMDPKELERAITKKTKAIIPVHMLGFACRMSEIIKICKRKKIKILEDNCESIGAKYNNRYLGSLGHIGAFSFDHGKIITTGEGGLIITNNKKLNKFVREYHDHGHENNPKYSRGEDTRSIYGFNYRMTELQGVIGKVQLKKLNYIIKKNKLRYNCLNKILRRYFEIRENPKGATPNYDTFIFYVKKNEKRKILKKIKVSNFGTKNLPDAIKWHCSAYWNHALSKTQVNKSLKTKKLLLSAVAIPINLTRKLKDYKKLAENILSIKQ
jgi:8-amino-3,8-dideoxy-alpha-D-manno-octulosonate transaminase